MLWLPGTGTSSFHLSSAAYLVVPCNQQHMKFQQVLVYQGGSHAAHTVYAERGMSGQKPAKTFYPLILGTKSNQQLETVTVRSSL